MTMDTHETCISVFFCFIKGNRILKRSNIKLKNIELAKKKKLIVIIIN